MAETSEETPLIPTETPEIDPPKNATPEEIKAADPEPEEIKPKEDEVPAPAPAAEAAKDVEAKQSITQMTESFVPKFDSEAFKASAAVAASKTAEYSKVAYAKGLEYGKVGAVVASAKAKEMSEFVMDGPVGFRLLALIGGCGVFWFSVVSMVNMYHRINIWRMISSMYNIFLGFCMILMESTAVCKRTPWRNEIYSKATFLRTTFGRGFAYAFIGVNLSACNFDVTCFWTGVYVLGVGGIYMLVGVYTQAKITLLRQHLKDEDMVLAAFDEHDADGSGELDPEEFAALCGTLGVPMKKVELLAVFDVIDTSDADQRKNRISKEEFLKWWSEWDELADVV